MIGLQQQYTTKLFFADVITVSNHCGGILSEANNTITLPKSLASHHNKTVYCDWTVNLQNESWIDLYIEEMQTKQTEVSPYWEVLQTWHH